MENCLNVITVAPIGPRAQLGLLPLLYRPCVSVTAFSANACGFGHVLLQRGVPGGDERHAPVELLGSG
jgi:hypothetical protein